MSMQFRYKLAKETFKGKKVPPKDDLNEEHISADQRGNKNFSKKVRVNPTKDGNQKRRREDSLLELGKETITEPETREEEKEVSRRDLFGFLNPATYAREIHKEKKPRNRRKRNKKRKSIEIKSMVPESKREEIVSVVNEPKHHSIKPQALIKLKLNVFKHFWILLKFLFSKLLPVAKQKLSSQKTGTDILLAASGVITLESGEPAELKEPEVIVRVIQKDEGLERDQIMEAKVGTDAEQGLEELDPDDPEVNRRNLIRQGLHFFAKPAVENISDKIKTVNRSIDKITKRKAMIRPPGALTEKQFLQACTRCDACIHACPKDAIKRAPKSYGFLVMGTPHIEPIKNPCVMCNDLYCISACEDGALKPVRDIFEVSMGYAILDKKHCMAFSNIHCQQCVIDCPVVGAITQNKDMQPEFHKNVCTGCGVCVRSCHTVNSPVAIKIKPQMVIDNQLLKKKLDLEKQEKENTGITEPAVETTGTTANFSASTVDEDAEPKG